MTEYLININWSLGTQGVKYLMNLIFGLLAGIKDFFSLEGVRQILTVQFSSVLVYGCDLSPPLLYMYTAEPPFAATSRKRAPLLSNHFSKIPKVFK